MPSDLEQVKALYDLMLEKNLDSLEIKEEDLRIKLTRRPETPGHVVFHPSAAPAAAPAVAVSEAPVEPAAPPAERPSIQAPLAGVFYRANSPTSAAFVKEGDVVENGQTLCIVEAMKVMNEIKAESRCKIVGIPAENGRPVTAGQPLFYIEPA